MKEQNMLTVLRCANGLRALYKNRKLVTTFLEKDLEHEVETAIEQHGGEDPIVEDQISDVDCIYDFDTDLDAPEVEVKAPKAKPKAKAKVDTKVEDKPV